MSIAKATENTITTFLKEELEKRKVNAIPFASIQTLVGRREVDILCRNSIWNKMGSCINQCRRE